MIVSHKMAEEALIVLATHAGYGPGNGLVGVDVASAKALCKDAAKRAHPDAGGTTEDFVAVDRAKHVLLEWLKRQKDVQPVTIGAEKQCERCEGRGFITSHRGFRSMRVQCPRCKGVGCENAEHEKGDYR